jgi:hypothetical protein
MVVASPIYHHKGFDCLHCKRPDNIAQPISTNTGPIHSTHLINEAQSLPWSRLNLDFALFARSFPIISNHLPTRITNWSATLVSHPVVN